MKVKLLKQIHCNSATFHSNDIWVIRDIDLPSIPPLGLVLDFGDGIEEKVTEVVWNLESCFATVYVEGDNTFSTMSFGATIIKSYHDTPEFKKLIRYYCDNGWTILEREGK